MSKICHAHCPPESGGILAAIVVVVIAGAAVIVARIVAGLLPAIFAALATLTAASAGVMVYVLRRESAWKRAAMPAAAPARTALPPARRSAAISAPRIRAIEAPRPPLYGLTSEHPASIGETAGRADSPRRRT